MLRQLIWKECAEARWMMYVGLLLFWVLPLVAYSFELHGWAEISLSGNNTANGLHANSSGMIDSLGLVYALLLGVAILGRDIQDDQVPDSWRVMPVCWWNFICVKYLTGLSILIGLWFLVHLSEGVLVQAVLYNVTKVGSVVYVGLCSMCFGILVYTIGFTLMVWIRLVIPAVLLGITLAMLVILGPMLIPSLEIISLWTVGEAKLYIQPQIDERYFQSLLAISFFVKKFSNMWLSIQYEVICFLLCMLGMTVSTMVFCAIVTKKQWQLRIDGLAMAWFFGIVGLGLLGLAAMQVGNNLTPESVIPVSKDINIIQLITDGKQGMVLTQSDARKWDEELLLQPIQISQKQASLGLGVETSQYGYSIPRRYKSFAWNPKHAAIAYFVEIPSVKHKKNNRAREVIGIKLHSLQCTGDQKKQILNTVDLQPILEIKFPKLKARSTNYLYHYYLFIEEQTLWFVCQLPKPYSKVAILQFDITNPQKPILIKQFKDPGYWPCFISEGGSSRELSCTLKIGAVKGISKEQMWRIRKQCPMISHEMFMPFEDRLIRYTRQQGLQVYVNATNQTPVIHLESGETFEGSRYIKRVDPNGTEYITYVMTNHRRPTTLEKLIGTYPVDWLMHKNFVYILVNRPQSGVVVYDVKDQTEIKKVGYYYAPNERLKAITALDDGRVILAGNKLHILNPKNW